MNQTYVPPGQPRPILQRFNLYIPPHFFNGLSPPPGRCRKYQPDPQSPGISHKKSEVAIGAVQVIMCPAAATRTPFSFFCFSFQGTLYVHNKPGRIRTAQLSPFKSCESLYMRAAVVHRTHESVEPRPSSRIMQI